MPQVINADGKQHVFPDEATPEQISQALTAGRAATWWDSVSAVPSVAVGQTQQSIGGTIRALGDLVRSPAISDAGEGIAESGEINTELATPKNLSFWKRAALSGGSSVLQQIPTLALSIASGGVAPALAGAAAMTGGQSYNENREAGLGGARSAAHAGIDATVEAAMELFPTKFLLDNVSGPVLKLITGTMLREVPTEVATTAIQNVNAKFSSRPDMTLDEYGQELLDTIGATMVAAPLLGGAAGVMNRGLRKKEPEEAVPPGDNNPELPAPTEPPVVAQKPPFDEPSVSLDSNAAAAVDALIASIDADMLTDADITQAYAVVEEHKKLAEAPALPGAAEAWPTLQVDPGDPDMGATAKQASNYGNYVSENDDPRVAPTFSYGPEGTVGLRADQVLPQAATYVLGQPTQSYQEDYTQALYEQAEETRKKYLPNSTLIISLKQLPFDRALGWHHSQGNQHVIIPAPIRSPKEGMKAFNPHTQRRAFFTFFHEVGHAIISDRFFGVLDPILGETVRQQSATGLISEDVLAQLPEEQQAVLREYNALRFQIDNNTLSAADYVEKWLSPGKVMMKETMAGINPLEPATKLIQKIARDAAASRGDKDPTVGAKKFYGELMSVDEYLAEQMAKYAYQTKWDLTSPIARFFRGALDMLRKYFTDQKRNGNIAPGVAFTKWMEGLTKTEQATNAGEHKTNIAKNKKVLKATPKVPAKKATRKVAKVQHNVETDTHKEKKKYGEDLLMKLIDKGKIDMGDPDVKKMLKFLRQKDYDEFIDLYKKYDGRKVHFELKPEGGNWTDVSVKTLVEPLLGDTLEDSQNLVYVPWAEKAVRNYLQKYAATNKDPLKDIMIPFDGKGAVDGKISWLEAWKRSISAQPLWLLDEETSINPKAPLDEPTYRFDWSMLEEGVISPSTGGWHGAPYYQATGFDVDESLGAKRAIIAYLEHVRDYISEKNLSPEELAKYDLVRLIKETAAWDKELAKNMQKKRADEKLKSPVLKEYPDGFYWQQLTMPGQFARESDAMGHSVRGYEPPASDVQRKSRYEPGAPRSPVTGSPVDEWGAHFDWIPESGKGGSPHYGLGGWEAIKRGDAKIYSLRDKEGNSHVTVETGPPEFLPLDHALRKEIMDSGDHRAALRALPFRITQIKGKQNIAPGAAYLPYVQDFVKSGNWDEVRDLQNTGLNYYGPENLNVSNGNIPAGYYTPEEYAALEEQAGGVLPKPPIGHFDLDDTPEQTSFLRGIRNFMSDPAPLRRALRRGTGMAFWALEIQQLAHIFPDLVDLASFVEFNTRYNMRKASLQAVPDRIADEWSKLGKDNFDKVSKVLLEESEGSEHWYDLQKGPDGWKLAPNARTIDEYSKRGIDVTTEEGQELLELILKVKNDLLTKLGQKEKVLAKAIATRWLGNQAVINAKYKILAKQIHTIRKSPFFPQGRFGNLMLTIERHKPDGGWEVIHKEAFESRKLYEEAHARIEKGLKADERVQAKELTDQQYVLLSLPLEFLDIAASELGLSDETGPNGEPSQVEQLAAILQPIKSEKVLKSYEQARLGIKGASTDALRSYANFTWHDANLIAKLEYRMDFNATIRNIGTKLRAASFAGAAAQPEVQRLTRVQQAMKQTRDYIMSPPNEAQMLRGIVAVSYLGLNPKTALMNFFGVIPTWSAMTSDLGLIQGSSLIARATKQMFQSLKWTDLNARRPGTYLPEESQKALDQAIFEGVLSQSYAYHLAGVANSSNLFRMPGRQMAGRVAKRAVDAAMWPFRLTELGTRRITFLAAFEQARMNKELTFQEAYDKAVAKTNLLQNDFSSGNRIPLMRGISTSPGNPLRKIIEPSIPLATVFMSFAQHMAFHAYGGYELGERRAAVLRGETPRSKFGGYTMKIWLVMLFLAGYEGLPGAENILDLLEAAWRKFGNSKPIRQELREFVQSIEALGLDPQAAAHGFGHNVAGFDVSRSIGLGRLVPGTDTIANPGDNTNETVGALMLDMLGPTGGIVKFGLESMFSQKPLSETAKRFPGGLGNMYNAYDWSQHGVRAANGALVTHDSDTGKLRDLTQGEILGKALGFNPEIVSRSRTERFDKYDQKIYWLTRQDMLLDSVWKARWQKDKEGEADARKAILDFNASVPMEHKALRINGATIARSMQVRARNKRDDEAGRPPQKKFNSLYDAVSESYDRP